MDCRSPKSSGTHNAPLPTCSPGLNTPPRGLSRAPLVTQSTHGPGDADLGPGRQEPWCQSCGQGRRSPGKAGTTGPLRRSARLCKEQRVHTAFSKFSNQNHVFSLSRDGSEAEKYLDFSETAHLLKKKKIQPISTVNPPGDYSCQACLFTEGPSSSQDGHPHALQPQTPTWKVRDERLGLREMLGILFFGH